MPPKSKSSTPVSTPIDNHPANTLLIGTLDQKQGLARLLSRQLSNEININDSLKTLRNDFKYISVMNWIYQCRGFVKLASEYFDIDLFEIELLDLVNPLPIDEMALFINKLKLALISKIQGKRVNSLTLFEQLFRMYFGSKTPLGGEEEDEDEDDVEDKIKPEVVEVSDIKFDSLNIGDKIEVLFICIKEISQYADFRDYFDKNKFTHDMIRMNPIYSEILDKGITEDYVLVFDDTTLYKRIISYPMINIPKKRKLSPEFPEEFFKPNQFDIIKIKFELIYKDIYQLDTWLTSLKLKRSPKFKTLGSKVQTKAIIESIYNNEIKKRKILANRKKEFEMARLLATRKKSSRLQAKEQEKLREEQERKIQEEEDLRLAAQRRAERRRLQKEQKVGSNSGLTREQRLDLRLKQKQPSPEQTNIINGDDEVEIVNDEKDIDIHEIPDVNEVSDSQQVSNGQQVSDVIEISQDKQNGAQNGDVQPDVYMSSGEDHDLVIDIDSQSNEPSQNGN